MIQISLIVPVFKAEAYIHRCVESILNQTVSDWELILVDDGSPDTCPEICDSYSGKDSRIRVIHQKNAGVSAARNRGLQEARGEWIGFVDSDDWAEPDMFSKLLSAAGQADLVMCDAMTVYEDGRKQSDTIAQLSRSCVLKHEDCTPQLMPEFAGAIWRCIYRKKLLDAHQIRFPEGQKFSEDRVFNLYAMGFSESIHYVKDSLYNRYVNMESCVNTFHPDYAEQGKRAYEETVKAIDAAFAGCEEMKKVYLTQYADVFFHALGQLRHCRGAMTDASCLEEVRKLCQNEDLRKILSEQHMGGRQGRLILKKKYRALLKFDSEVSRHYEKWLNYWYGTWICRKIWNFQEFLGLRKP